jgi:hypothetical protein
MLSSRAQLLFESPRPLHGFLLLETERLERTARQFGSGENRGFV